MKKLLSITLIVLLTLSLAACGNKAKTPEVVETPKDDELIGIWAYADVDFDYEEMKKSYEESDMEWEDPSEEEIQQSKDMYTSFMAGMYFEFKNDNTAVQGYYMPDEEPQVSEALKYENGNLYTGMSEPINYVFTKDGKLSISQDGIIMLFEKVNSVEDIKNTEAFKKADEINRMYEEYTENVLEENAEVEEAVEENTTEESNEG